MHCQITKTLWQQNSLIHNQGTSEILRNSFHDFKILLTYAHLNTLSFLLSQSVVKLKSRWQHYRVQPLTHRVA
jgi:hypothetical protein